MRAVHLNPVEPGKARSFRCVAKHRHDARDFLRGKAPRHFVGLYALRRANGFVAYGASGARNGENAVEVRVRRTAWMPELHNDAAAAGVYSIGDRSPSHDAGVVEQSGLARERTS